MANIDHETAMRIAEQQALILKLYNDKSKMLDPDEAADLFKNTTRPSWVAETKGEMKQFGSKDPDKVPTGRLISHVVKKTLLRG